MTFLLQIRVRKGGCVLAKSKHMQDKFTCLEKASVEWFSEATSIRSLLYDLFSL